MKKILYESSPMLLIVNIRYELALSFRLCNTLGVYNQIKNKLVIIKFQVYARASFGGGYGTENIIRIPRQSIYTNMMYLNPWEKPFTYYINRISNIEEELSKCCTAFDREFNENNSS